MIELEGNIWDFHKAGFPIVITTNGDFNSRGENVMGKGIALQAKQKFPELPGRIGEHLKKHGNRVGYFSPYRLFSFPTKNSWKQNSDIVLIEQSARHLEIAAGWLNFDRIYMVRPGCSNGKLKWEEVKPVIASYLDDRFIVVQN